jgi:hypothetical protein
MKVFAQSTLANGSPYIHLGYLSATHREPHTQFLLGGFASLALGVTLVGFALLGKVPGVPAFAPIRRQWIKFLLAGCALLVMGPVNMYWSYVYGRDVYVHAERVTEERSSWILKVIGDQMVQNQVVPDDLAKLAYPGEVPTDGWGNPLRLVVTREKGSKTYAILSAGRDRRYDTADDLRFTLEPSSRPANDSE